MCLRTISRLIWWWLWRRAPASKPVFCTYNPRVLYVNLSLGAATCTTIYLYIYVYNHICIYIRISNNFRKQKRKKYKAFVGYSLNTACACVVIKSRTIHIKRLHQIDRLFVWSVFYFYGHPFCIIYICGYWQKRLTLNREYALIRLDFELIKQNESIY